MGAEKPGEDAEDVRQPEMQESVLEYSQGTAKRTTKEGVAMTASIRLTVQDIEKLPPDVRRLIMQEEAPSQTTPADTTSDVTLNEINRKLQMVYPANLKYVVRAVDFILNTQEEIEEIRKCKV